MMRHRKGGPSSSWRLHHLPLFIPVHRCARHLQSLTLQLLALSIAITLYCARHYDLLLPLSEHQDFYLGDHCVTLSQP